MRNNVNTSTEAALSKDNQKKLVGVFIFYAATVFIPAAITLYIMKRGGRNYKRWKWVPLAAYFFPYLMIACYYLYIIFKDHLLKFKLPALQFAELTNMRYDKKFPLWLYYDPYGRRHKFPVEKAAELTNYLRKGDIILRRHENYMDSLILTQASFFTHAGICTGVDCKGLPVIAHAIGKTGVDHVDYYDFMRCDDVAVLRLEENMIKFDVEDFQETRVFAKLVGMYELQKKLLEVGKGEVMAQGKSAINKALAGTPGYEKDSVFRPLGKADLREVIVAERTLIENTSSPRIGERQLTLFENLLCRDCHTVNDCIDVITDMFKIYYKRPYDYLFNFADVETMSCIEFVWYCYKCITPKLKVGEKEVNWFENYGPLKVKANVILPDSFVTNSNALQLVYTSVRKNGCRIKTKEVLAGYIEQNLTDFRDFHKQNLKWQSSFCAAALVLYFTSNHTREFTGK